VLTLRAGERVGVDHNAKVALIKKRFFPTVQADLSDIASQINRAPFIVEQTTTVEEIATTLASCSSSSAPGDDEIPFHFLKALGDPIHHTLAYLTNVSLRLEYLPPFLKKARTIVLKKPGKATYELASSWRPIALLKTIGKVIEKIVVKRIREAIEAKNLLPPSQIEV